MIWKRFCAAKKTDYGYVCRFAKLVVAVCTLLRTLSSSQPCGRESTICLAGYQTKPADKIPAIRAIDV